MASSHFLRFLPHLLYCGPGQAGVQAGFREVVAGWDSSRNRFEQAFTAAAASFLFHFLRTKAEGLRFRFLAQPLGLSSAALEC